MPSSASSLHSAMRDWEENCIDIPAITARLEESQGKAGTPPRPHPMIQQFVMVTMSSLKPIYSQNPIVCAMVAMVHPVYLQYYNSHVTMAGGKLNCKSLNIPQYALC